ncbi:MAG TPA: hypothetical protein ENK18_16705 [Deltaproteobacteria bacterium]|nr:hypothetical protein [Deltaproteobacteria bacterium]
MSKKTSTIRLGGLAASPMRSRGERDGRLYWRVRTSPPERRTVATGWWSDAEVAVAVANLVAQGVPAPRERRRGVRTVAELLEAWCAHQARRHAAGEIAPRTLDNYRRNVSRWCDALGDVLVDRLSRPMVEDQLLEWQSQGGAPRSCRLAATVLRAALRWGERRGLCPDLDLSRLGGAQVREDEYVNNSHTPTRDELIAVLEVLEPGRDQDTIRLLALTGARVGEIAAARVGDYRRGEAALRLHGRDAGRRTRGKVRPRSWPVLGELQELLERLCRDRDPSEPLIEGLPVKVCHLTREVLGAGCDAAGVPRFTAHGIRRMVAMELIERTDPRTVSELTGHSVKTLLTNYVRPRASKLREVVSRSGVGRLERRGQVLELPRG